MARPASLYREGPGVCVASDGATEARVSWEGFIAEFNAVATEAGVGVRIAPLDVTWDQWAKIERIVLKRLVERALVDAVLEDMCS